MDKKLKHTLMKKRAVVKSRVIRIGNYVSDFKKEGNLSDIRVRQRLLETSIGEYNDIQSQLEVNDDDAAHNADREAFEELCLEIQSKIETLFTVNKPTSCPSDSSCSSSGHNLKLPTIQLPKFTGRLTDFMHFRDTFQTLIIQNESLTDIQRYYYLLSCVSDEAHKLIENLPITQDNFIVAWNLICSRYHNPRLILDLHVKELLSLPSVRTDSPSDLRLLINQLCSNLNAIKALHIETPLHDVLLSHLILERISLSLRTQWENRTSGEVSPRLENLISFLESNCQTLEIVASHKSSTDKHNPHKSHTTSRIPCSSYATTSSGCEVCNEHHSLSKCQKFREMTLNARIELVETHKLCYNCLRSDHRVSTCTAGNCRTCNRKHHTLLHKSQDNNTVNVTGPSLQRQTYCSLKGIYKQNEVLLSTAIVHVKDRYGQSHECRALLDSGSQLNFMSHELAERLDLKLSRYSMLINGISNRKAVESSHICQLNISSRVNDYSRTIVCTVLPQITGPLPASRINCDEWQLPKDITFADPHFNHPHQIDLLLGAAVFFDILQPGQQLKEGHPTLQNTLLGWVLAGYLPNHSVEQRSVKKNTLFVRTDPLHSQVERFWEQEEIRSHPYSNEEKQCEEHFSKFTTRDKTGRFVVRLPFRCSPTELGDSLHHATNRFGYMERKLQRQPTLKTDYVKFMDDYLQLGHMEIVESSNHNKSTYYMPHHAVVKDSSTTTKLRVVFDASSKTTSSLSLNDIMMIGPTVQPDLFSIILRFRKHKYVLTGDIEKMYRQVLVHPVDRDLQKILWRSSPEQPLQTYRLTTVTYGTAAAPFLATRCLKELANEGQRTHPMASNIIRNDFYVDDLLTGTESIQDAIQVQEELTTLLKSGGFLIRKWCANHPDILASIPVDLREIQLPRELYFEGDVVKTLGILWHPADDMFRIESKINKYDLQGWTKRTVLAKIASIFDPLGLLGPVVVRCKLFIQMLWQLQVDWDEPLPTELETIWLQIHQQLPYLSSIEIPRKIMGDGQLLNVQLHGFSDASQKAYGACVYLRFVNTKQDIFVSLVTSKSRVAPLKQVSLPRLELCGALLLTRLMDKVSIALDLNIQTRYYWTDSTIVLAWIAGCPTSWKTYVANRVSEIQDLSRIEDWKHVASQDNPADILSRGLQPQQLGTTRLWWAGPQWLQKPSSAWPQEKVTAIISAQVPEQRRSNVCLLSLNADTEEHIQRFSSWTRLHRVTAYILRFCRNLRHKNTERQYGSLTTAELQESLKTIVRITQQTAYGHEIQRLQQGKTVSPGCKLAPLCPFLDQDNLVRVGGRLENASASYDQKHPLILPPTHRVTRLLIQHEHYRLLHAGSQQVLASLRHRIWFSNGRSTVRQTIHKCLICFKQKAATASQLMGQLPASRVTPSKPFSNCGVDYGGPLFVKYGAPRSKVRTKCYIALFVCMATKAVHIELVSDLSSDAFIAALRRFISRRGRCSNVYSDNGTSFIGAMNKLNELFHLIKSPRHQSAVEEFAANEGINWHFIPPQAPHFGGLWEAGIKSVKSHLKRTVGDTLLTFEELYTLLTQVEACMNSRPITPLPNNSDEFSFLTPGHFLIGEPLVSIPEPDCLTSSLSHRSRWQLIQRCRQQIWKRWSCDYLSHLQQRTKWQSTQHNIVKGTLVLIKEDNLPPLTWRTGIIEEVHPGADGYVRVVSVRTTKGTYKRPVTKICPFPYDQ